MDGQGFLLQALPLRLLYEIGPWLLFMPRDSLNLLGVF